MNSTIYILGSGGFANELKNYIDRIGDFETNKYTHKFPGRSPLPSTCVFLVDNSNPDALNINKYHNGALMSNTYSILGSGKCDIKVRMSKEIFGKVTCFIHPKATMLGEVGEGCILAPGAVLAPQAKLGNHVLCNYNSTVGHDTIIGDFSVISPNASVGGNCVLGKCVYVGSNASIREKITIGDNSTVAMGAVVVKDIPANHIAVGVPAKIIPLDQWKSKK